MKTLIIYDNDGKIFLKMSNNYPVPNGGIQFLEVDESTNENKIITGVNVETKELITEDIPKTDVELLQEQINSLTQANAELISIVANIENNNV